VQETAGISSPSFLSGNKWLFIDPGYVKPLRM